MSPGQTAAPQTAGRVGRDQVRNLRNVAGWSKDYARTRRCEMVDSPGVVHRRLLWIMTAAVAVLIGPLAWYLGSPLILNRTVDESAPSAGGAGAEARAPLSSGSFGELDAIHKGEGQAVLFTLPDGQPALRFENFKVTNGPDL